MVFPTIMPANSVSGGYEIDNSLRFNDNDSARLTFTPSGAGNRRTFTLSVWFKLQSNTTTERVLLAADDGTGGNNNFDYIAVKQSSQILIYGYTGSENQSLISTQALRDPSAWYHLVVAFDTTQATAANRIKVYLNGSQVTDFATANYPSENFQTKINNANAHRIGSYPDQDGSYFDGYMSEYHVIDGAAKASSDFGKFDNNGVWVPKEYTGDYGTNGFYLEFKETGTSANSSGIGADTSGNDHHWAVTNLAAIDVVVDTPTNNFATANPLSGFGEADIKEGNCLLDAGGDIVAPSTIGFSSGKWYMEMKSTITAGHGNRKVVGIYSTDDPLNNPRASDGASDNAYPFTGVIVNLRTGVAVTSGVDGNATDVGTFANNDICSLAYDGDNGLLYIYKNGTILNSGNALNASNALDTSKLYLFYLNQDGGGSNNGELFLNFGNPSFAVSSGNADANGYGNFEYAVPSGYYSLCTKNLAEFG